jgi:hypothetical protein
MRRRAMGLAILFAGATGTPAFAGDWKFVADDGGGHAVLTYSEDSKVTFMLGCGHAFVLHVKYPGEAKKDGAATIVLASGKQSMTLKGEFEVPEDESATTFTQVDLGYRRQDPGLYEKKWEKLRDQLLDLMDSGQPLKISAGGNQNSSTTFPPIAAPGWRKALGECG